MMEEDCDEYEKRRVKKREKQCWASPILIGKANMSTSHYRYLHQSLSVASLADKGWSLAEMSSSCVT